VQVVHNISIGRRCGDVSQIHTLFVQIAIGIVRNRRMKMRRADLNANLARVFLLVEGKNPTVGVVESLLGKS